MTSNLGFFYSEDRKHARMSMRKTAELLGVAHTVLIKLIRRGALNLSESPETIIQRGVDGGALAAHQEIYYAARLQRGSQSLC